MRFLIFLPLAVPVPALAHIGHVAEVAGHAHWIGLAAAFGAAALGAWLAAGKDDEEEAEAEISEEEEPA
jgi:hypothetical protein